MDLTIFIGKKSFMTYLVEEKNPKITVGVTVGA
jgi:hypothetical protein